VARHITGKLEQNILRVLDHGQYIMGPEISELERALAGYVGTKYAISCASGTDALLLALMAYGVGPGDAIFTTPFTFIATAEVISLLGAIPVFVDIDPQTYNLDPIQMEKAIVALQQQDSSVHPLPTVNPLTPMKPKGIIPVDLFGLPADYDRINDIARKYGLFVIEDGAQSFGGEYKNKKACSLADIGCTSFFPAKPLGCYGDGGMCFTDNEMLAHVMCSLRVHGKGTDKYDNVRVGINGRMDTLQAAILLAKFDLFPAEVQSRNQIAAFYNDHISAMLDGAVTTPHIQEGYLSVWAQYSVLAQSETSRNQSQIRLKEAGVPTAIYYPKPLHLQPAFSFLGYRTGDYPIAEDCAKRIFSLPMHPYLKMEDQRRIVSAM